MRRQILAACALAAGTVAALTVVYFMAAGMAQPGLTAPAPERPTPESGDQRPRHWGPTEPAVDPETAARLGERGRKHVPALAPPPARPAPSYAPDELIVGFRSGVGPAARKALHDALGTSEVGQLERSAAVKVSLPPGSDPVAVARSYARDSRVTFAQPNYGYATALQPTDPAYVDIQHWYYHVINAPAGWDIETGSSGVVVAVLDTGVDITHPDLAGQIWTNPGEVPANGLDDDANGCIDDVHGCYFFGGASSGNPADDFGHGTFVGGVACGETNNGVSGAGVAFDCTIMPVKVLTFGGGESVDIAAGIVYAAENGADIINMSLGSGCLPGTPPSDPVIQDAMDVAHDIYGVTIVASAGNANAGCVSLPAADPNAIAVSASGYLDDADGKSGFSQWGPEVAVTAPGVDIVSAVPPAFCNFLGECLPDGRTTISSGTSFSAPQVSGLAALLLAQDGTRTNEEVRTIMTSTARDLPDGDTPNWDGAGRIDVTAALGGDSVFAPVRVAHGFPPVLRLSVGVGSPSTPSCEAVILDVPPILASRVRGTFGVSECAASWPPDSGNPWFLKATDFDLYPDEGQIADFALESAGLVCTAFDTPVAIPDDDPAGGVSTIDCPALPELSVRLSPPARVVTGEPFDYELEVKNRGQVSAGPVVVEDILPPEVALAGPPPAGCSQLANTVTCDIGTLASGETKIVTLTVDALTPGLITNCATVDPLDAITEAVEGNNTFCADTELIFLPPPAFINPDPADDVFGFAGFGTRPDITELRGGFDADEFFLTVEFGDPLSPGEIAGFIDFDTDQDPVTGSVSEADFSCQSAPNLPPGMTGSDVIGDLFSPTTLFLVDTVTFELVGTVPLVYGQNTLTAAIPLEFLGGDDALDFTTVLGSQIQPTDCAPNGTTLGCADGDCVKLPPPPPPPNDDFADAAVVAEPLSPPVSLSENTQLATLEPNEPQPCGALRNTIWYEFTPSRDTLVSANLRTNQFAGLGLAAYTGATLGTLDTLACDSGSTGFEFFGFFGNAQPRLTFMAEAGATYHIQAGTVESPFESPVSGLLILTLHGIPAPSCAPGGTPGDNNGFEAGFPNTKLVPCWSTLDQTGSAGGGWCVQAGGQLPSGECASFSFAFVNPPPEGLHAVMTNASGNGTHLLFRCGVLDIGTIIFRVYVNNEAFDFSSGLSLDYRRFPNQQFRADLVSAAGMTADPFTIRPQHILANLYRTDPGDPRVSGYTLVAANVNAHVGQNVCLRFAEVDSSFSPLHVGIDDVRFITAKDLAADTDADGIPNQTDPDDDNDGCTDAQESGTNALLGGRRDGHSLWDFMDVPTGPSLSRDGAVTAADLAAMVARFGATDHGPGAFDRSTDPFSQPNAAITPSGSRANYHPAFDRGGTIPGLQPWNLLPANGSITASDLAAIVAQFGHSCV